MSDAHRTEFERWVKARPEGVAGAAKTLGVGRVAVHRYMAGRVMPRPDRVADIERLTGGVITADVLTRDFKGKAKPS